MPVENGKLTSPPDSYFPIAILSEGSHSLAYIDNPENLPVGTAFRIILTKVTSEQFMFADKVCKRIVQRANGHKHSDKK